MCERCISRCPQCSFAKAGYARSRRWPLGAGNVPPWTTIPNGTPPDGWPHCRPLDSRRTAPGALDCTPTGRTHRLVAYSMARASLGSSQWMHWYVLVAVLAPQGLHTDHGVCRS
eukprot:scaffold56665_cov35-Tisochrysis_lutea.AAC.2